jgi:hypothetical protein
MLKRRPLEGTRFTAETLARARTRARTKCTGSRMLLRPRPFKPSLLLTEVPSTLRTPAVQVVCRLGGPSAWAGRLNPSKLFAETVVPRAHSGGVRTLLFTAWKGSTLSALLS